MAVEYLDKDQISAALAPYGSQYGGGIFGNSQLDDYRNYRGMLRQLNSMRDEVRPDDYGLLYSGLKSGMATAGAGMAISGLTGLTGIVSNAMQGMQVGDINPYQRQLQDYSVQGHQNYNNYSQLANDYSQNYLVPIPKDEEIRGMTNGEKVGNVLSSTLAGASAGMAFGPWGAAIGAGLGLAGSYAGIKRGDSIADANKQMLKAQTENAAYKRQNNFAPAHERITDRIARTGMVHAVAQGGEIDRVKESISSYTDNKLKGSGMAEHGSDRKMTRIKGKDGVTIRIRVK